MCFVMGPKIVFIKPLLKKANLDNTKMKQYSPMSILPFLRKAIKK